MVSDSGFMRVKEAGVDGSRSVNGFAGSASGCD